MLPLRRLDDFGFPAGDAIENPLEEPNEKLRRIGGGVEAWAFAAEADGSVYKFYLPREEKRIGSEFGFRHGDETSLLAEAGLGDYSALLEKLLLIHALGGMATEVVAVTPATSTLLLLTDPDHAVPVLVQRNGIRLVAYGTGRSDRIELANVPISGDVRVGDRVVTSGLGGRFPPGFPVGTVSSLRPDESRAFLVGELTPAAQLDRGRNVLLLRRVIVAPPPPPTAAIDSPAPGARP